MLVIKIVIEAERRRTILYNTFKITMLELDVKLHCNEQSKYTFL